METEIEKPYCRGGTAIFRKLANNGAECVIDFRDVSLLPSVLFHLNGEYHDSQMFIRESLEQLRTGLASRDAEIARLLGEVERMTSQRDECAMLVKRISRRLDPTDDVRAKALDYLVREGLTGSMLRENKNGLAT